MAPPRLLLVLVALLGMVQHAETVHTRGVSVHTLIHPSAKLRHHAPQLSADETSSEDAASTNALLANPLLTASGVALGLTSLIHAPTFATFAAQWSAIRDAGVSGDEFWAPLQFWIFFAIGHPLIKPAVAIGEVLHSAPGPLIGLLPATFVAANLAVLALLAAVPKARSAAAVAVVALTVNFVGCGLEGTVNQGDYNLALDDGVKGCPTYEQVRQPSMDSFDIKKYDGRWYEHAFHDWTQFSEVYDTTFDVELSADGTRWLDDFGVRGPSPKAAPISWDKSPVANGAHYFLKATYDPRAPGIVQESGFGVTFPNYIIDVKKGADGEYSEAIQFQCLQRGGVRIFEGINYLTRDATQTPVELAAMHERAAAAGIAPYGANPEQMHVVEFALPRDQTVDNEWQQLWKAIGVDQLLALIESSTHSAFEVQ